MSRTIQGIILALCCVVFAIVLAAPAPQAEGTVLFFNYDGHHPQNPVRYFTDKTADNIINEIIAEYTPQRNPGGFPPGHSP